MLRTLRTRNLPFALLASTLLTLVAWATPATADTGERRGGFELFYALPEPLADAPARQTRLPVARS